MDYFRDPRTQIDRLLDLAKIAGVEQSDTLKTAVAGWTASPGDPVALYAEGCITDDATKRERAMAIASAAGIELGQLRKRAEKGVIAVLATEIKSGVADAYRRSADAFTAAADKLVASHAVCPVNTTADVLAAPTSTKQEREAWAEQPRLAKQVQAAYERLVAAAELHGLPVGSDNEGTEHVRIPLVVTTEGIEVRRPLFTAWRDKHHRLSRWGALVEGGFELRAAPVASYQPIAPDAGTEVVQVRTGGSFGGIMQIEHDLESGEPRPASEPRQSRQAARVR